MSLVETKNFILKMGITIFHIGNGNNHTSYQRSDKVRSDEHSLEEYEYGRLSFRSLGRHNLDGVKTSNVLKYPVVSCRKLVLAAKIG